ncbi:tubulin-folding cofactor B [Sporobolomyces salmoneus]|uniref:tubulin-folding cofactor B n=1 Tax=Sporobolomyces salmoneus TaxID=183962 RepID=UPI0031733824
MSYLNLWISSSDTHSERRIGSDITISQLKSKLEPVTGIPYDSQQLSLRRTSDGAGHSGAGSSSLGELLAQLDDDQRTLDSYGVREWMTIRVESSDPNARALAGQYSDDSRVEKFELTKEEYEARNDTVLAYKMRHQLGRFAPTSASASSSHSMETEVPKDLVVGARCEVALSPELSRRGTVRFVGPTEFGAKDESVWVGVEWDEPVGKGNGTVDGKVYFETLPMRASFVRPDKVTIGDFPEIDPFAEDDEEMEM